MEKGEIKKRILEYADKVEISYKDLAGYVNVNAGLLSRTTEEVQLKTLQKFASVCPNADLFYILTGLRKADLSAEDYPDERLWKSEGPDNDSMGANVLVRNMKSENKVMEAKIASLQEKIEFMNMQLTFFQEQIKVKDSQIEKMFNKMFADGK